MKKYLVPLILIIVLTGIWTALEVMRPRAFSWIPTYINNDKDPYGCYIFYREALKLHDVSGQTVSRLPASEILSGFGLENTSYFVVAVSAGFDKQNLDSLLSFVASGNTALIVAGDIDQKLVDTLGLTHTEFYNISKASDTMYRFSNPGVMEGSFSIPGMTHGYFGLKDSLAVANSIIEDQSGRVRMLRVKWGEGTFILGKCPMVFTNWFVLQKGQENIPFRILSFLPGNNRMIWDEFQKQGRDNNGSSLRVILSNPSLKLAYFITLFGILLILLFETRRKQSVVPVIEPVKNTSLDFVRMVGLLHYEQKDYRHIGTRRINNLFENIRLQYNFSVSPDESGIAEKIHLKTGYNLQDANKLVKEIRTFLSLMTVGKADLVVLNMQIEDFYKRTKQTIKKDDKRGKHQLPDRY